MNYIAEILAFNDWLGWNQISTPAVVLWYALLYINNKQRWVSDFPASIDMLKILTKLQRKAIYDARNVLKQKGLITFQQQGGNKPAIYHMISLVYLKETQKVTQTVTQDVTQEGTQDVTHPYIYKQNETKQNIEEETAREDFSFMYDQNLAQVARHFESVIGYSIPRPAVSAVMEWLKTMPPELICAALDEAAMANAKNWKYAAVCLRDWNAKGIRTLDALKSLQASDAARQRQQAPEPRRKAAQDEFLAIARGDIP